MIYTYKTNRGSFAATAGVVAVAVIMFVLLMVLPQTRNAIEGMQSYVFAAIRNMMPQQENKQPVAVVAEPEEDSMEAKADKNDDIVFRKEFPRHSSIIVKLKPNKDGSYLFKGESCIVKRETEDVLVDIGEDGDMVELTDIESTDYYVECEKIEGSDEFSFLLLYSPTGTVQGANVSRYFNFITGSGTTFTQPRISGSTGSQGGSSQPVNNYSPSNSFSPTNNNNYQPSDSGGGTGGTDDGGGDGGTLIPDPGITILPIQTPLIPSL